MGYGHDPSFGHTRAFRWDNGVLSALELGSTNSRATAITNSGLITGQVQVVSNPHAFHGFFWSESTGAVVIAPADAIYLNPTDINENGMIVGHYWLAGSTVRPFAWTLDGGFVPIPIGPGLTGVAHGVNDSGRVVVSTYDEATGSGKGYVWEQATGFTEIESPYSGAQDQVVPRDVNNSGVVTGSIYHDTLVVGFTWSSSAGTEDIGNIGEPSVRPAFITNNGTVIGSANVTQFVSLGFVKPPSQPMAQLVTFGGPHSEVYGHNAQGAVVGNALVANGTTWSGAYWKDGLVSELALPHATHSRAQSVNASSWVVGWAVTDGLQRGVIWKPTVVYNFSGFFSPVDAPPALNSVKAGQSVPVKFSLGGNQGMDVLAEGYPVSQSVPCSLWLSANPLEETSAAGNSSLSYDARTDMYTYVWKSDQAWTGTCRTFTLKLKDGSTHSASFQFTK